MGAMYSQLLAREPELTPLVALCQQSLPEGHPSLVAMKTLHGHLRNLAKGATAGGEFKLYEYRHTTPKRLLAGARKSP